MKLQLQREIKGLILDIGGGGEGVISQLYPDQVIAIDNRRDELEEVAIQTVKIVMDAREMLFTNSCFDNITAFYSFMYISKEDHSKVLSEIKRVLKPKGQLHIWDTEIKEANPFLADLDIAIQDSSIHTTYGIYKDDATQDGEYYKQIIHEFEFKLIKETNELGHFYQCWERE